MTAEGRLRCCRPPFCVEQYHFLVVELEESCAPHLTVTARSEEGEIMALAHRRHPTYGVQFHPESILTPEGHVVLINFVQATKTWRV
ncbi:gamma-glutamyl-gamma-aminobutyrate hydrolase family protein [Bradyrhizobium sp. RDI18]|uniref:glutamine amidotransferase-related protein n=1 Tax=Bradyrhizobium sp. RDI18 TaxID=3367400 RepID=UPI0037181FB0